MLKNNWYRGKWLSGHRKNDNLITTIKMLFSLESLTHAARQIGLWQPLVSDKD